MAEIAGHLRSHGEVDSDRRSGFWRRATASARSPRRPRSGDARSDNSSFATIQGPQSLSDMRRHNGAATRISKPEILDKLRLRLNAASDGGGQWTTAKVAAFLARELGLEKVAIQRGCEALKTSDTSIDLAPAERLPRLIE